MLDGGRRLRARAPEESSGDPEPPGGARPIPVPEEGRARAQAPPLPIHTRPTPRLPVPDSVWPWGFAQSDGPKEVPPAHSGTVRGVATRPFSQDCSPCCLDFPPPIFPFSAGPVSTSPAALGFAGSQRGEALRSCVTKLATARG